MDDLRIPKIAVEIICHTFHDEILTGNIFLDMMGSSGYTVEQVLEFFDDRPIFFPYRLSSGGSILLQKQMILRADLPEVEHDYNSEVVSMLTTKREVVIHFTNAQQLKGLFLINLPADHARTLDFLNTGHRFVPFLLDEQLTLINTQHIYKVEEV